VTKVIIVNISTPNCILFPLYTVVCFFWPRPKGLWSKFVHHIRNSVPFWTYHCNQHPRDVTLALRIYWNITIEMFCFVLRWTSW
jgi:hypothetical protein